jgi:hypothetical protein
MICGARFRARQRTPLITSPIASRRYYLWPIEVPQPQEMNLKEFVGSQRQQNGTDDRYSKEGDAFPIDSGLFSERQLHQLLYRKMEQIEAIGNASESLGNGVAEKWEISGFEQPDQKSRREIDQALSPN